MLSRMRDVIPLFLSVSNRTPPFKYAATVTIGAE